MAYEDKKRAYDEDLKKYGYVKQSTINSFAIQQEQSVIKKSTTSSVYLRKLHNDITEY
jgi:hypothetical protein